ncbi:low affinity iron permease family protein [Starkeya sp. ORNL1]|uniref:low affinity iron permease family protein n=1 Tax=Starkeya sp. ORNL1 TaxID=2709380 RepID=UPI0032B0F61E
MSTPCISHHRAANRPLFGRFANASAHAAGTPVAFLVCLVAVLVWAATGPMFGCSETWQLGINTGTTIVTFLMVFLIQNSQNRGRRGDPDKTG